MNCTPKSSPSEAALTEVRLAKRVRTKKMNIAACYWKRQPEMCGLRIPRLADADPLDLRIDGGSFVDIGVARIKIGMAKNG